MRFVLLSVFLAAAPAFAHSEKIDAPELEKVYVSADDILINDNGIF